MLKLGCVVVQGLVEDPQHETPEQGHSCREQGHKQDELEPAAKTSATDLLCFWVPEKTFGFIVFLFILKILKKKV